AEILANLYVEVTSMILIGIYRLQSELVGQQPDAVSYGNVGNICHFFLKQCAGDRVSYIDDHCGINWFFVAQHHDRSSDPDAFLTAGVEDDQTDSGIETDHL